MLTAFVGKSVDILFAHVLDLNHTIIGKFGQQLPYPLYIHINVSCNLFAKYGALPHQQHLKQYSVFRDLRRPTASH